jgi:hypothetical protein
MSITGTAIIYLILGAVVAIATLLRENEASRSKRAAGLIITLIFWPIFLPFLLGRPGASSVAAPGPRTEIDQRIDAVEDNLLGALSRLHGIAEDILAPEVERVRGLAGALHGMGRRLIEMDRLLATPEFSKTRTEALATELEERSVQEDDPRRESLRARAKNIDRLTAMRARLSEDLERALFKMEEMSSQMVLLNFAGRPEAEAVHMIKEIAASNEGVTEGLFDAA